MAKSTKRAARANSRREGLNQLAVERNRFDGLDPKDIPADVRDWLERIVADPEFFIEQCLWIPPIEGGELIPLKLSHGQRIVVQEVKKQLAEGRPVRIIVLKSRRAFITTVCQAIGYWVTSTRSFTNGIVMAHDLDTAAIIFRIAKLFYDYDERRRVPGLRPQKETSNRKELRFANPDKRTRDEDKGLQSGLIIETAEGSGIGRGLTLHFQHCSEAAKYDNPDLNAGLQIALTKAPGTIAIWESTADGVGNVFEVTWDNAVKGKNDWTPIFLPWFIDPKWWDPLTQAQKDKWEWASEEEKAYAERHGLQLEQMAWRRKMLASPEMFRPGVRPEDVFRQEFPATAEEAFVASGKNFFLTDALQALKEHPVKGEKRPVYRARVTHKTPLSERSARDRGAIEPTMVADPHGELWVWEDPQPGMDYVIGADVAEGLAHGDNSVLKVLCRNTLHEVACWRARSKNATEFGQVCVLVAWWYNRALLGIERNGPGLVSCEEAKRLLYPRLWHDRDTTKDSEPSRDRVGWTTTPATRSTMLEQLEAEIRNRTVGLHDAEFFAEARTFIVKDGKPQAQQGRHDDSIFGQAIALQMHIHGGALMNTPKKRKEPPTDYKPETLREHMAIAKQKKRRRQRAGPWGGY